MPSLLWADLDEVDPRDLDLEPTIAIQSSPRRYVGLWRVDTTITEDLNKRLTYAIGADKGGWDLTQVLRVPGTYNYKYDDTPKVNLLWENDRVYQLSEINDALSSATEISADYIFEKFKKKMPRWLRRELREGRPTQGKRSDMLWKMEHALLDIGCSIDEAFELLKPSPWNKFKGRDHQLRKELEKVAGAKNDSASDGFALKSLAEVEIETVDWVWYPYFARGEVTIVEGDPGIGKSYLVQMACKAVCDGDFLPSVRQHQRIQAKAVYFDFENSASTVTKRRMASMKYPELFFQEEAAFSMNDATSFSKVREALERHKPAVVAFDTLNNYLGKIDTNNAAESAQSMMVFRALAKEYNCAVVLVRHVTKGDREKAIYRGQGSIAFAGVARVVIICGEFPDRQGTMAMAVSKLNLAPKPTALTYTISGAPSPDDPDASEFRWGEYTNLTAEQLFGGTDAKGQKARADAVAFLEQALAEGPVEKTELQKRAREMRLSWSTVKRAANEIGVEFEVSGYGKKKHSVWRL